MAEQEGASEPLAAAAEGEEKAPEAAAPAPAEAPPPAAEPAAPAEAAAPPPPAEEAPAAAAPAEAPAAPAPAAAAPAAAALPEVPAAPAREIPPEVLERVGAKKNLDEISVDELKAILKEYYDRWVASESAVYDIAHSVRVRDHQIHELEMEVSDMRGKFIIPKLKKVHNFKLMGENE